MAYIVFDKLNLAKKAIVYTQEEANSLKKNEYEIIEVVPENINKEIYEDKKEIKFKEKSKEIEVPKPIDLNKRIEDLEKRIIALENKAT